MFALYFYDFQLFNFISLYSLFSKKLFNDIAIVNYTLPSIYGVNHFTPLQGLSIPTTQIPICVTPVSLSLPPTEGEPEDACAFVDTDNESSRPIPIIKNINMAFLFVATANFIFIIYVEWYD
jgi:hypothetical protein